jgi:hypothetical protein
MSTETVPDPDDLRAEIRARTEELRAKRRLLKLAEAARAAREKQALRAQLSLTQGERRGERGQ